MERREDKQINWHTLCSFQLKVRSLRAEDWGGHPERSVTTTQGAPVSRRARKMRMKSIEGVNKKRQ